MAKHVQWHCCASLGRGHAFALDSPRNKQTIQTLIFAECNLYNRFSLSTLFMITADLSMKTAFEL